MEEAVRRPLMMRIVCSRMGPNTQSIFGASVGLIGALLLWVRIERHFHWPIPYSSLINPDIRGGVTDYTLIDIILNDTMGAGLPCLVVLAGVMISFFSPVGGIPQSVGLLGFVFNYWSSIPFPSIPTWESSLGIGFVLGVASTLIVLNSPARAMLAANGGKPVRMLSRFAALSPRTVSSWK